METKKAWKEKGFTMAELLIVVAIIAVLVAIAIPIFSGQLEKSKEGTDADTLRNAYAKAALAVLDKHDSDGAKYLGSNIALVEQVEFVQDKVEADNSSKWTEIASFEVGGLKINSASDSEGAADTAPSAGKISVYYHFDESTGNLTGIKIGTNQATYGTDFTIPTA